MNQHTLTFIKNTTMRPQPVDNDLVVEPMGVFILSEGVDPSAEALASEAAGNAVIYRRILLDQSSPAM